MDELFQVGNKLDTFEKFRDPGTFRFRAPGPGELPPIPPAEPHLPIYGLRPEWVVVIPGLLFLKGGFVHDPVLEWLAINEQYQPLQLLPIGLPLFDGGYDPYDRYVIACRWDAWEVLSHYLGSLKAVSPDGKRVSRAFLHRAVLEPEKTPSGWLDQWKGAVAKSNHTGAGLPPPVPVIPWVVGVTTSAGDWYISSGKRPTIRLEPAKHDRRK